MCFCVLCLPWWSKEKTRGTFITESHLSSVCRTMSITKTSERSNPSAVHVVLGNESSVSALGPGKKQQHNWRDFHKTTTSACSAVRRHRAWRAEATQRRSSDFATTGEYVCVCERVFFVRLCLCVNVCLHVCVCVYVGVIMNEFVCLC